MSKNKRLLVAFTLALSLMVTGCGKGQEPAASSEVETSEHADHDHEHEHADHDHEHEDADHDHDHEHEHGESPQPEDKILGDRPVVYASTDPIYDFATRIAGDAVQVIDLMPGIVDAHHWEPTPDTLVHLNKADMLLINGADFEMWLPEVKGTLDKVQVVDTASDVDLISVHDAEKYVQETADEGEEHHHHHGDHDPHYWLSIKQATEQAEAIKDAFVAKYPEKKEQFEKNYDALKQELEALEQNFEKTLAAYKGKSLLVPHQAYTYLCKDFDMVQIPVEGLLAEGEPNAKKMATIIDQAKQQGIQAVFYDPYGDHKVAEQIANELGVKTLPLYTLESVSKEDREKGENYLTLMQKNLESIRDSFGGAQ